MLSILFILNGEANNTASSSITATSNGQTKNLYYCHISKNDIDKYGATVLLLISKR